MKQINHTAHLTIPTATPAEAKASAMVVHSND